MAPGMAKQKVAHNRQYGPPAPGVSDSDMCRYGRLEATAQ